MSDFPKFQLSKFLNGSRDYQVVVRTDDADELIEAMKQIKPLVKALEGQEPQRPSGDVVDRYNEEEARICRNCGKGKMVKNPKTGKWFCADKCWLQVKPPQAPLKVEEEDEVLPDDVPF